MRNTRIELDPIAIRALRVEAADRDITPKELLTEMVLAAISDKTRDFVGITETVRPVSPRSVVDLYIDKYRDKRLASRIVAQPDERGLLPGEMRTPGYKIDRETATISPKPENEHHVGDHLLEHVPKGQKPRIDETPELVERVKDLWANGTRTSRAIATEIGYGKTAVGDAIKRMKESGVLEE